MILVRRARSAALAFARLAKVIPPVTLTLVLAFARLAKVVNPNPPNTKMQAFARLAK